MQANRRTKYSDNKTKAKFTLEYSVLYPDTNSDSDSLKSNGARWVSAKVQVNHKGNKDKNPNLFKELTLWIE